MYIFRLSIGVTVEIPRNVEFDSINELLEEGDEIRRAC